MKKLFLVMIFLILIFMLCLLVNGLLKLKEKQEMERSRKEFPKIKLYHGNQTIKTNLFKGKSLVFFILNPDCYYCEYQIEHLIKKQALLSELRFYLLIPGEKEFFKNYENKYAAQLGSNMSLLRISQLDYLHYFGNLSLPAMLYYDENKQLISCKESFVKSDWILNTVAAYENK